MSPLIAPTELPAILAVPVWVAGSLILAGAMFFGHRDEPDTTEADDELQRLRSAALEASERRDEFLGAISHELRSPLNAILGWTQVLEPRSDLPDDVRQALQVIRRNALRQRQLLEDLVDMSRVLGGDLRIETGPVRIQDVLDDACRAVQPEMDRKGLRLDCSREVDVVVEGDARRLEQVVRSLLGNALRFTPAGGTVTVRAATLGAEVSITVADTGSGIAPALLPHVFEAFKPHNGTAAARDTSFGLGLALARIVVVGHGGRIFARSDGVGLGSTFTVFLPTVVAEKKAPPSDATEHAGATRLAGVRVLAVDDEPDWRELLGHIFGAAGADARIAGSAAEAIQILEGWRPDVVLTDIAMPVTDGYGLLSSIRSHGGAGRAVPAIAMTAHAGAQERTRSARAGFAAHLAKPIPPHELIDAVCRVVEHGPRSNGTGSA